MSLENKDFHSEFYREFYIRLDEENVSQSTIKMLKKSMPYREQEIESPNPTSFWGDIKMHLFDMFRSIWVGFREITKFISIVMLSPIWGPFWFLWSIGETIRHNGAWKEKSQDPWHMPGLINMSSILGIIIDFLIILI